MDQYFEIGGHRTWVADDATDLPPLLLLHGGLVSSANSWGTIPAALAPTRRVIRFDRRGHGRTSDSAEPFHYRAMAAEAAGVIETLGLAPVDAVGYSDGANLLMHLALDRPELLRSMVLISGNYHHDALYPESADYLKGGDGDGPLKDAYAAVSPDGKAHWPTVFAKGLKMGFDEEPTFTTDDLAKITTPTLVLASDDDMFPVEHTVSLYRALPTAQLAIVPATSHLLVYQKSQLIAELVEQFLQAPVCRPLMAAVHRRTQPPAG